MPRNSEASQQKILAVAVKIFARKGFDGARVDEIAREAGVNKALIYYYFKSKSLILEEVFRIFHQEANDLLRTFLKNPPVVNDTDWIENFFESFMEFLEIRKDILKIMFTESLKSNDEEPPIFGFLKLMFNQETEQLILEMKRRGFTTGDYKDQIMVTEFFTDFIPVVSYIIFKDKWCRFFDIEKEKLKTLFFEAFTSTHVAYHIQPNDSN